MDPQKNIIGMNLQENIVNMSFNYLIGKKLSMLNYIAMFVMFIYI